MRRAHAGHADVVRVLRLQLLPGELLLLRESGFQAWQTVDPSLPPLQRAFEAIPDDWSCPICGTRKSNFIPYHEPALLAA